MSETLAFGVRLRRLRLDAGLSLGDFARLVHYDKGYLSKVENGLRTASPDLARRCDALLDASGGLAALVRERQQPRHAGPGDSAKQSPPANPEHEDEGWLQRAVERRQAIKSAAGTALGLSLGIDSVLDPGNSTGNGTGNGTGNAPHNRSESPLAQGGAPLAVLNDLLTHMRRLGQVSSAQVVLPMLVAQTNTLLQHASNASSRERERDELLNLTARYAEYTGWMAQEAGHDQDALAWTRRAVDLASAGGDKHLAGYSLIRQALVTMYRSDSANTVALAQQARARTTAVDIQAQAARREAQGHALAGDYDSCMACLDQARHLQARADASSATAALGPTHLPDPIEMITGWCLYDLGRPRAAAEVLDRQIAALAPDAARSQARYGIRRALAYAGAGEIDHACTLTGGLLDAVDGVNSATVAIELRNLARTLTRFRSNTSVRRLSPRLTASLHVSHL